METSWCGPVVVVSGVGMWATPEELSEGQECGVIKSLAASQCESLGQRRHQLTQLQAFEQPHQIRIDVHDGTSAGGVAPSTSE